MLTQQQWISVQWLSIALLGILWLFTSGRVAYRMSQRGHNAALWFLITVCATAIPAMIVLRRDAMRPARGTPPGGAADAPPQPDQPADGPALRCPHCRQVLPAESFRDPAGTTVCPRCNLPIDDEANLA